MAVTVMAWVWERSRSKPTARLVLLAIADHANGDGVDAFPSMAQLMSKTGLSERAVQKAIGELVDLGELHVSAGGGRGKTNRYRVLMVERENPAPETPYEDGNPAPETPYDINPAPDTPYERSETPHETTPNPARRAPGTKREPKATVKNSPSGSSTRTRGTRIPAGFAVTDDMRVWAIELATEVGGRPPGDQFDVLIRRWTAEFIDYWTARAGRDSTKVDWIATWRNRIRTKLDDAAKQSPQPGTAVAVRGHNGSQPYVGTSDRKIAQVDAVLASFKAKTQNGASQ